MVFGAIVYGASHNDHPSFHPISSAKKVIIVIDRDHWSFSFRPRRICFNISCREASISSRCRWRKKLIISYRLKRDNLWNFIRNVHKCRRNSSESENINPSVVSSFQRRWNKNIKQMLSHAKGNLWLWATEVHENPFEFISTSIFEEFSSLWYKERQGSSKAKDFSRYQKDSKRNY